MMAKKRKAKKDKRPYTGPIIAGPLLEPSKESPICELCGLPRNHEAELVYKVHNGDWFHATCYESSWEVCVEVARKTLLPVEKDETINLSRFETLTAWLRKTLLRKGT